MEEQNPNLSPKKEPEEIKTEETEEPEPQKQEPEEPKQQATVIMRSHVITTTGTLVEREEQPREAEQEVVQNPSPQELEQFEHPQPQYIVTTEGSFQAAEYQEQYQAIEIPENQIQHITIHQEPQYINLESVNSTELPQDFQEPGIQQYLLSYNGRTEENGSVLKDAMYQNFEISQPGNLTLMGENGTTTNIYYNPVSQYPQPSETYNYPSTSAMPASEVYSYPYPNHEIEYENGIAETRQCVLCGRALSGMEYKDNLGHPMCSQCFASRQLARYRGSPARSPKKQAMVNTRRNNVQCANCKTSNTTLWRRNNSGEPVCNACGLYYKLHNVNRPQSMKKEGIQTRKRKPKNSSQGGHSMNGMAHGPRTMMINSYSANEIPNQIIEHYQPQGYITQPVSNHPLPTINTPHRRMQLPLTQIRVPPEEQATVITSTSVANRSNYGQPSEHDGHEGHDPIA